MSLEVKRLEVQLANVKAARMANELRVDELLESVERLKKDLEISMTKEVELEDIIKNKKGIKE